MLPHAYSNTGPTFEDTTGAAGTGRAGTPAPAQGTASTTSTPYYGTPYYPGQNEYYTQQAKLAELQAQQLQQQLSAGPLAQLLQSLGLMSASNPQQVQVARSYAGPLMEQAMLNQSGLSAGDQGLLHGIGRDGKWDQSRYPLFQLLAQQQQVKGAAGAYDQWHKNYSGPGASTRDSASLLAGMGNLTGWQQQAALENQMGIHDATGYSKGMSGGRQGSFGPDGQFYPTGV